jgi:hypothetical protein
MVRDAVQPTGDRGPLANGSGPPRKHQEGGLESGRGVLKVPDHVQAGTPNHRPVAAHDGREGRFVVGNSEPVH